MRKIITHSAHEVVEIDFVALEGGVAGT